MSFRSRVIRVAAATSDPALKSALLQALQKDGSARSRFASDTVFWMILDQRAFYDIYQKLDRDEQSQDLLHEIMEKLSKKLALDTAEMYGLNRLRNMIRDGKGWDEALLRNNVFKVADSLGIRLPSSLFASEKTAGADYEVGTY